MDDGTEARAVAVGGHGPGHGLEARAFHEALAHVRDVEQAGVLARPIVLGEDAGGVLHRHVIAGEGHHASAELHVFVVE